MTTELPLLRPDTQLYIYYIEGVIPANYPIVTDNFAGNWVEDNFSFLFFTQPSPDQVAQIVDDCGGLKLIDEYEMSYAEWQGGTVEPVKIGRFIINPTWIKASPAENEISLTLDSGVVFGNGNHATTQTCLEAIDIACSGKKVTSMLDLGTGTGILAVAAANLGCQHIVAVDFNYLAAQTALRNVRLNGLEDRVIVVNGRAEEHIAGPTDLLVANIHYDVMKKIVASDGFLKQKWFVLSGLLTTQAEKIVDQLRNLPVLILKRWNQDQVWHTILGITRNG
ncbi:50S ribosomal protein L11 methyltransferase [Desulforhopalus singaporensis]|uniref:Ribosomal protein L11 methyltransferase n=1 Tax=Desulforhopalus singaporensis TaxID=91360 RepID=A0A1H0LZA9_9BACT|nr:50S ribosomal protein L11 methyltransferase [Desulforhopalus singaporensis]SDO73477.1 ribosomal protein L11 methyltransferase [Desulforhopalus singaporensis]